MSVWGASGAGAAVSVTFDNLGEAAQLQLGMWPDDVPQGRHFTVLEVLPRLLELLAAHGLRATFFVEGLNAEMYPEALHTLARAGHEVAMHAWCHEEWTALDAATEAALLDRATQAMRSIGLRPRGFRPPGGGLNADTLSLLAARGYTYVSPAGARAGLGGDTAGAPEDLDGDTAGAREGPGEDIAGARGGLGGDTVGAREGNPAGAREDPDGSLAVLPFRWPLVDAYAFLPQFAGLRERYSGDPEPHGPERMREEMIASLHTHAARGGHLALLFHPFAFAFTGEPGWTALDEVLQEIARLAAGGGGVAALRMDEAAAWMLAHAEDFSRPPQLDDATWMAPSG